MYSKHTGHSYKLAKSAEMTGLEDETLELIFLPISSRFFNLTVLYVTFRQFIRPTIISREIIFKRDLILTSKV